MRLEDILSMMSEYLGLGIVALGIMALSLVIGYWLIYKKICKGKRQLDFKKLMWWSIFLFYMFVVLSVTLLRRSGFWNGQIISFFYSYKDAWITASPTAWRNIILNILMFVPLGFWLPFGKERFRVFWKTSLFGCLMTVVIESFQLILSLGIFEVADVFNNTLGTMIGFGFYKIVEFAVLLWKKQRPKVSRVVVSQIPLIVSVVMFGTIFIMYQVQELGNLAIECISPFSEEYYQIVSNEEYSKEQRKAFVYKTNILTVDETEAFAKEFFVNLGTALDESRNDIYEETAFYWAEESYSLRIQYKGGTYSLTDYDTSFPEEETIYEVTDASDEEIREVLHRYGIVIPEEAIFSYVSDVGYVFELERFEVDGLMLDGELICEYCDNGKFADIRNDFREYEVYKEFDICSEQEAFEQILDGEFVCAENEGAEIEVGQVDLDYMLDSKGFYQPIYRFDVQVDGRESVINIPAILK